MNRHDHSIAVAATTAANKRWRDKTMAHRASGIAAATVVSIAETQVGGMLPDFPESIPVIGGRKVHSLVGAAAALRFALKKNPSKLDAVLGYAGLALAIRAL